MNNKSRTLVNIIGIPLILGSIYIGGYLFASLISVIIILGTIEYNKLLIKNSAKPTMSLLMFSQIILIVSNFYMIHSYYEINIQGSLHTHEAGLLFLFFCYMGYLLLFIIAAMIIEIFKESKTSILNISSTVFGFLWIGVFISLLVHLRFFAGAKLTLIIFVSLWICDTFAFFFGKNFGKTKIIPEVSPNKTIVGTLSGVFGSIFFLILISYYNIIDISLINALILGLITGGVSQFGDFFESKLKREIDIKDTSNILKGHGGILDRFDSLSIISPLLLLFVLIVF